MVFEWSHSQVHKLTFHILNNMMPVGILSLLDFCVCVVCKDMI